MKLFNTIGYLAVSLAIGVAPVTPAALARPTVAAKADSQRFLVLEGSQNLRDLGGYRTADGHRVKWGLIYRSATMSKLTPGDFAALQKLGVKTIIDLRSSDERTSDPMRKPDSFNPTVLTKDYQLQGLEISKVLASPNRDAEQARKAFEGFYATLPYQFADQYKRLFAQLLARQTPLVFHCTAGKDRTGVAAALLLTALGVPRETIVQDYLLSKPSAQPRRAGALPMMDPRMGNLPREIVDVLMGVDERFINAAFAAIEARSGSVDAYFRNDLGLTRADLRRLRSLYLR
jgi:protein-tyrosine phosphatase